MYILGKDKLGFINGDYPQPPETDPSFRKWRTKNAMVKGWLINSMDHSLVVNFIRYPTAKRRVSQMKQAGGSIEKYYNDLQGLWREINFRLSNLMACICSHLKGRSSTICDGIGAEAVASSVVMAIKRLKSGHSQTLLKFGSSSRSKGHLDGNKCTHYRSTKHTRETCFKLHGYRDRWHKLQARKKQDALTTEDVPSRAAVTTTKS
ncbi:hypothetical protein AAG906_037086 [Vitis piasezkii]